MTPTFDFQPPRPDPLGVLSSTAPVAAAGDPVRVDANAVRRFARRMAQAPAPRHAQDALHATALPPLRFANYLLLLEALNFCFWDDEPRWRVGWAGARHDGYWALAAALRRGLEADGLPLWDAGWMAAVDEPTLGRLLRGEGRPVPLLAARVAHVREAGRVLLERWDGQFTNLVRACRGDAVALALRIVEELPSFRDEAVWAGSVVRFYKRAQICVADLARMGPPAGLGRLHGLERLTAFADYKVPQVLRKEGILVYAASLAQAVDGQTVLAAGGSQEVAIRAGTIWACAWIARALSALRGAPVSAMDVDYLLWSAGQDKAGLAPYHRTRTAFY
ncbi:MAG: hypothetical protein HY342_07275 [Candidatus Lambdaproteobacteria bacterium]|nr:hypothetical protein [Candidatus Lambdaproteobacteria bacterium]